MKLINFLYTYVASLHRDTKGASAIEYAIIAGLIAVAIIATITLLGVSMDGIFGAVNDEINEISVGD